MQRDSCPKSLCAPSNLLLIVVATLHCHFVAIQPKAAAEAYDLTTFGLDIFPPSVSFPAPQWNITPTSATHVSNADASVLYSPTSVLNKKVIGVLTPGTDDDVVGFVLGYQPGDASSGSASKYMLIDWKGATQGFNFGDPVGLFFQDQTPTGTMPVGLALSEVTGLPTADELWQHTSYFENPSGGVTEIARGATLGSAAYNRTNGSHVFEIAYSATNITVKVDGVEQFNVNGSFPDGRFGLYSAWQGPTARFSQFEVLPIDFSGISATVDRASGNITLQNSAGAVEIDYYEFASAGNSLNPTGWTPIDAGEMDSIGQGWDAGGGANPKGIAEAYLDGAYTLAGNASLNLGAAYNNTVNAEDLVFTYRLAGSGLFLTGAVNYVGVAPMGLDGDFNSDGVVDARDYVVWRNNLNGSEAVLNGNGDGSGTVDAGDYTLWKSQYGQSSPGGLTLATAVPEPASCWIVASVAGVACFASRRRRRITDGSLPRQGSFRMFKCICAMLLSCVIVTQSAQAVLVAHYQFENNLNDSSGNGHTGIFVGTASIVNDPVRGNVLNIPDSGNQGVNIDTIVPIPDFAANSSITLTAWYKRVSSVPVTGNFRYVVDLGQNGNNPIASLGIHSGGYIASYVESDEPVSNGDQVDSFGSTVIEGNATTWASWHHLAVVYDRSTDLSRIYVDGVLDSTTDISRLRDDFAFSWPAANIGRGPEGASSTAPGLIDEVRIYNHALSSNDIINVMGGPVVVATVNRTTGELMLQNMGNSAGMIASYSISSGVGGLNPAAWTSVTDNYDSGGAGSIDTNPWAETSATASLLSEAETPAVNGGLMAPGQSISLGQVWQKSIYEDLSLVVNYTNGLSSQTRVMFEGGVGSAPFLRSDLNFDGNLTLADWQIYIDDLMSDLSGLTTSERYRRGDLNGDGLNNGLDFAIFKADYDALNGAGAFQAALTRVPEPATIGVVLVAAGVVFVWRRRQITQN